MLPSIEKYERDKGRGSAEFGIAQARISTFSPSSFSRAPEANANVTSSKLTTRPSTR